MIPGEPCQNGEKKKKEKTHETDGIVGFLLKTN